MCTLSLEIHFKMQAFQKQKEYLLKGDPNILIFIPIGKCSYHPSTKPLFEANGDYLRKAHVDMMLRTTDQGELRPMNASAS